MNKTQKISLIALIVLIAAAVLIILVRGNMAVAPQEPQPSAAISNPAPAAPVASQSPAAAAVQQVAPLGPLPADNKQAIDSELSNIERELSTTDNLINSDELSDQNLGM